MCMQRITSKKWVMDKLWGVVCNTIFKGRLMIERNNNYLEIIKK